MVVEKRGTFFCNEEKKKVFQTVLESFNRIKEGVGRQVDAYQNFVLKIACHA